MSVGGRAEAVVVAVAMGAVDGREDKCEQPFLAFIPFGTGRWLLL